MEFAGTHYAERPARQQDLLTAARTFRRLDYRLWLRYCRDAVLEAHRDGTMLKLVPLIALVLLPSAVLSGSADIAWEQLKGLVGTWRIAAPTTPRDRSFAISYRLISRDTVLVETFGDPAKQPTETVYHRDGSRLLATHYCAQGNQPRLALSESTTSELSFDFVDATNLASPQQSHLVRLKLRFTREGQLIREETYREDGHDSATTLTLVRE